MGSLNNQLDKSSYGQILKATTLIGGTQIINTLLGIVRVKILAVLLGPSGVGIISLYNSVTGIIATLTGMGIGNAGVRQIAEAVATGDHRKISTTIRTLRRSTMILGIAGMSLLFLLRKPICQLTFGNTDNADDLAVMSVTLAFGAITGGQVALIQGMRRIVDLAKLNVISATAGTVLSITIIYFFRQRGIAWFLVALSATTIITSWCYARRINITCPERNWQISRKVLADLMKLGVVFMASSLITAGTTYFLGVMVVRKLGIESTGLYQTAVTLSSVYIGVILGAMGTDFYPRLTTVAMDNIACNRMVNEQAEIGILLAVPGILAILIFAPLVINIFYSNKFLLAVDVLRWQILGMFLRVICWPMGYILLAKGAGKTFFMTESISNIVHILFMWVGLEIFGLTGTGIAFFCFYVFYSLFMYLVVHRISGFRWSEENLRLFAVLMPSITLSFLALWFFNQAVYIVFGSAILIFTAIFSYRNLMAVSGLQNFPSLVHAMKIRLGLTGA